MKTDKILIIPDKLDLDNYKNLGIQNFLFPLRGFSVGYKDFTLDEIKDAKVNAYLLVNRILTDEDIDLFQSLNIPSNVKGIFMEDIGLYYVLKDSNYFLVCYQNHLNNNYKTVNYWLRRFDSLVLSSDITFEESEKIVKEAIKPVIAYTFGIPMIMYSRRTLVNNYLEYQGLKKDSSIDITLPNNEIPFHLEENSFGTAVFKKSILDNREECSKYDIDKIKFYLYNANFIGESTIINSIMGEKIEGVDKGFMYQKTVYRIGDLK